MTTKANVILSIGSKMGPGGLASLQAGINMVGALGGRVLSTVKDLDEFNRVLKSTDMHMVNLADSAAKGQIDTLQLMKSLNQIKHAFAATGVEITAEQFKILAQRSTILAQTTGQDATQAFKGLTDSVSKGTTRALKEYGIYISQGTDLAKTHRDILKQVTEGYSDLNVEIGDTSERMYALSNNWDTALGLVWSKMTQKTTVLGKTLNNMNTFLSAINLSLTEGTGIVQEYVLSWGGMLAMVKEFMGQGEGFSKMLEMFTRYEAAMNPQKKSPGAATAPPPSEIATPKKAARGGGSFRGHKAGSEDLLGYDSSDPVFAYGESLGRNMSSMDEYEAVKAEYESGLADVIPLSGGKSFRAGSTPAEQIVGPFKPGTGPRRADGDLGIAPESFAVDVDAKLDDMMRLEEQRMLEQVALMERMDEYKQQQAEIYDFETGWQIEQLQFAEDFGNTWANAMSQVSAGTMAANFAMGGMKQMWGVIVDAAIHGSKSIGAALKAILHEKSTALTIESSWNAAVEYAKAIAAAASYRYGAAAGHTAAAIKFTALAAGGFAIAKTTAGSSGGGAHAPSMSEAGFRPGPHNGGGYNQSYGGGSGGGMQNLNITIRSGDGLWDAIIEQNDASGRAGGRTFAEVA